MILGSICAGDEKLPALVLLHPYPVNGYFWENQREEFEETWQVVCPHFRGFDDLIPDDLDEPYTVEQFAKDILETLDDASITQAVFGGCSMGGYVLFELWRQRPSLFRGIILADTRAEADSPEARAKRDDTIATITEIGTANLPETATGMLSPVTRETKPEVVKHVRQMASNLDKAVITSTLAMLRDRPDSLATLPTINVPTLILVGEHDTVTPLDAAETMHRQILNSRMAIVPQAGHYSPLENPDFVNPVIRKFLDEEVTSSTSG